MAKQKYRRGDLVQIDKVMPDCMRHFPADKRAIVEYSYRDVYGGGPDKGHDYSIFIEGEGSNSWYCESQLTLIEAGQHDLYDKWRDDWDGAGR